MFNLKKSYVKMFLLLGICLTLVLGAGMSAVAAGAVYKFNDFEDLQVPPGGKVDSRQFYYSGFLNWTNGSDYPNVIYYTKDDLEGSTHGNILRFNIDSENYDDIDGEGVNLAQSWGTDNVLMGGYSAAVGDKIAVDLDFKVNGLASQRSLFGWMIHLQDDNEGDDAGETFLYFACVTSKKIVKVSKNEWHNINVVFEYTGGLTGKIISLTLDGVKITQYLNGDPLFPAVYTWSEFDWGRVNQSGYNPQHRMTTFAGQFVTTPVTWDIDNYKIYNPLFDADAMSSVPANDAIDVPVNSSVKLTFVNPVDATTLNTTNVTAVDSPGLVESIEPIAPFDGKHFAVNFAQALSYSTQYTLNVSGITDNLGQIMPDKQITFTTDADAVSSIPENESTDVTIYTDLKLTFSDALNTGTVNTDTIKVQGISDLIKSVEESEPFDGKHFTVKFARPLDYSQYYIINIAGVEDASEHPLPDTQISFTTTSVVPRFEAKKVYCEYDFADVVVPEGGIRETVNQDGSPIYYGSWLNWTNFDYIMENKNTIYFTEGDAAHGNIMRMGANTGTPLEWTGVTYGFQYGTDNILLGGQTVDPGDMAVQFDFKLTGTARWRSIFGNIIAINDDEWTQKSYLALKSGEGGDAWWYQEISKDVWHTMNIAFECTGGLTNGKYLAVTLDGVKLASVPITPWKYGHNFLTTGQFINNTALYFWPRQYNAGYTQYIDAPSYFDIDNFKFYKPGTPTLTSNPANGTSFAPVGLTSATIDFSNTIDATTVLRENVYILGGNAEISSVNIDPANNNRLVIEFTEPLVADETYNIVPFGVKDVYGDVVSSGITFTTGARTYISDVVFSVNETPIQTIQKGSVKVDVAVQNDEATAAPRCLIMALYGEAGILKSVKVIPQDMAVGANSFSHTFDNVTADSEIKVYLWSDVNNLKPALSTLSFDNTGVHTN